MKREFDIVIYGASGLAAKFIYKQLHQLPLKIAVSGRNRKKIEDNLRDIKKTVNFQIIECNLPEIDSLTARTKLLINCAGPYIYSGESIVKSCIFTKTHYIDITGETYFIERCIQLYGQKAKQAGVAIINCAGFDSVPADIGAEYLRKSVVEKSYVKPDLITIESILTLVNAPINKTTYESAILGFSKKSETKNLRRKNFKTVRKNREKVKSIFYSKEVGGYCAIFPGTDASVVRRSQNYKKEINSSHVECQYLAYFKVGSLLTTTLLGLMGLVLNFCASFVVGRSLLLKFPRFFTMGYISNERPKNSDISKGSFEFMMTCKAYNNGKICCLQKMKIKGPDPACNATAICAASCALSLLEMMSDESQSDLNLTELCGVLSPAVVFSETDIVNKLSDRGITFEMLNN